MLLSNLSNVIEEKATHLKAIEVKNNETTLLLSLMKEKDKKLANEKEIVRIHGLSIFLQFSDSCTMVGY